MNAVEFIRKFGWELAQRDIVCLDTGFITKKDFLDHYGFEILDEIRKYTDAYELVQSYGGLDNAKNVVDDMHYDATCDNECIELNKAITLVEEIGECDA